ncbi:hypothetical protein [Candidatus Enterovibrio escicola]|uniref:hypothetical protein n=1 Tax=Candidatus Enterovibrio escicola TaxID=1927127 RepID=UPI0012383B88|nr:hypothetical protein [Candidatus Enterovibrio escacola]
MKTIVIAWLSIGISRLQNLLHPLCLPLSHHESPELVSYTRMLKLMQDVLVLRFQIIPHYQ